MGGHGYMDLGLKHLRNILFVLLLIFGIGFGNISCTQKTVDSQDTVSRRFQTRSTSSIIGTTQSELVTSTVQCEKGNQNSCDRIPAKKAALERLLNN